MDKLEQQLNNLPKYQLDWKADLQLKIRIRYSLIERWISNRANVFTYRGLMKPAAVMAILTLAFWLPFYAYASPSVALGHPLYPIKQGLEKIESILPQNPDKAAIFQAKIAERRLAEAETLAKKGAAEDRILDVVQRAKIELEKSAAVIAKVASSTNQNISKELEEKRNRQAEHLIALAQRVGISEKEELTDQVALAIDTVATSGQIIEIRNEKNVFKPTKQDKTENIVRVIKTRQKFMATSSPALELEEIKAKVNELKIELNESFDRQEVEKLFERLDKKIKKAEQEIISDKTEKARGLIRATDALTNNAKHFLKRP